MKTKLFSVLILGFALNLSGADFSDEQQKAAVAERAKLASLYKDSSTAVEVSLLDLRRYFSDSDGKFVPAVARYVESQDTIYFSKASSRATRCRGRGIWSWKVKAPSNFAKEPKELLGEEYCVVGIDTWNGQALVSLWDEKKGRQLWVPGAGKALTFSGLFSKKNAYARWQLDLWQSLPNRPFEIASAEVFGLLGSSGKAAQLLILSPKGKSVERVEFSTEDPKAKLPKLPSYHGFGDVPAESMFTEKVVFRESALGVFAVAPSGAGVSGMWFWERTEKGLSAKPTAFGSERALRGRLPESASVDRWAPRDVTDWAKTPYGLLLIDATRRFGEWQVLAHYSPVISAKEKDQAFSFLSEYPVSDITGIQFYKDGLLLSLRRGEIVFRGPSKVFSAPRQVVGVPARGGLSREEYQAKQKPGGNK